MIAAGPCKISNGNKIVIAARRDQQDDRLTNPHEAADCRGWANGPVPAGKTKKIGSVRRIVRRAALGVADFEDRLGAGLCFSGP